MKFARKDYIINTVFRTNTLPVISECNTSCTFCSNKYNPEGVETYSMAKTSLKEFEEIIEFLSPDKKIVVGEAATRITEGEPLLYKDFIELMKLIRRRFKNTIVQVTTNGILLNEEIINELELLGSIELNISVNCLNPVKRKYILGLKNEDAITGKIAMISGRIKYSASCVCDPDLITVGDLAEMVSFLEKNKAESIRVFLPGYTKRKGSTPDFYDVHQNASELIHSLRLKHAIPIILEPPFLNDLECTVDGVIKDSPACQAGLRCGDTILELNGKQVISRVDGFNKAYSSGSTQLKVKRENAEILLSIEKPEKTSPGFIVSYDIEPDLIKKISAVVRNHNAERVLILTSELAYEVMRQFLNLNELHFSYNLRKAKNKFFGGTIKCAGLLTVEDINEKIEDFLKTNPAPDLILLPPIMFDFKGSDLLGRSMKEIEERFGIAVDTILYS